MRRRGRAQRELGPHYVLPPTVARWRASLAWPVQPDGPSQGCHRSGVRRKAPAAITQLTVEARPGAGGDQREYSDGLPERSSLLSELLSIFRQKQQRDPSQQQSDSQRNCRTHHDSDQDGEWTHDALTSLTKMSDTQVPG